MSEEPVSMDDALRAWVQKMGAARKEMLDVKYFTALGCITELELENDTLRRELATWKDLVAGGRVANKELNTRIARLQARIVELEPDAALGKTVREMPGGASIAREPGQKIRFSAVWPSGHRNKHGWMHYSERCYEDTPEAALEAASIDEGKEDYATKD